MVFSIFVVIYTTYVSTQKVFRKSLQMYGSIREKLKLIRADDDGIEITMKSVK